MKANIKTSLRALGGGCILGLAFLLPSVSQAAEFPETGDFSRGATVWADNCGRCHNIRDARELRDDQWITTVYHMRIRAGLTGQEARDVLTFLQESNKPRRKKVIGASALPASASQSLTGAQIYNQTCIACHGPDGKGAMPAAPDFTSSKGPLSKPDDILFKHILEGFQSPGSPMAMPAKGGNTDLTEQDIRTVLNYIRQTFGR